MTFADPVVLDFSGTGGAITSTPALFSGASNLTLEDLGFLPDPDGLTAYASQALFFRYSATASGTMSVSSHESLDPSDEGLDTALFVYTGSSPGDDTTDLAYVTHNDNAGGGWTSEVSFPVDAGETYWVALTTFGGYVDAQGVLVASVTEYMRDDLSEARSVPTGAGTGSSTGSVEWDMALATSEVSEPSHSPSPSGWLSLSVPTFESGAGTVSFTVSPITANDIHVRGFTAPAQDPTLDPVPVTFASLTAAGAAVEGTTSPVTFTFANPVPGTTLYVQVAAAGATSDPGAAIISTAWSVVSKPASDAFEGVTSRPGWGGSVGYASFSTRGATLQTSETTGHGTHSVFYSLSGLSSASGTVTYRFTASDPEFTVRVYAGLNGSGYDLASMPVLSTATSSDGTLEVALTPDDSHWYVVRVASPEEADFSVSWGPEPTFVSLTPDPVARLQAILYETDGVTKVTELSNRVQSNFQEPLNTPGVGELSIPMSDPVVRAYGGSVLFRYRRIVRFYINGVCVSAFRIRRRRKTRVTSEEYTGQAWFLTGPTVHEMLKDFHVKHQGTRRTDSRDLRAYNWTALRTYPSDWWFDPADWDDPVNAWSLTDPPSKKKTGYPAKWPLDKTGATAPKWINTSGGGAGGNRFFRKAFTISEEGTLVGIFLSADEWYTAYLDGELLIDNRENYEVGYTGYKKVKVTLSAGEHQLAVYNKSFGTANIGDGNDSLLVGVAKLDLDNKPVNPPILGTSAGWAAHKGAPPPGWYRAAVLRSAVLEAQARGVYAAQRLSIGYTKTQDTNGVPWTDEFGQEVQIGTSGLDLQQILSESGSFDVWVNPGTLAVEAYVRRGTDKSPSVALQPGRNLLQWETDGVDEVVNEFLVQHGMGWVDMADVVSQGTYGKTEGFISLSSVEDDASARAIVDGVIRSVASAEQRSSVGDVRVKADSAPAGSVVAVPGCVPFVDFTTGDIISAPDEEDVMRPHRVLSLTCVESAQGELSFDPELEVWTG